MEIDKRTGLIIGAVATGLAATVAGITAIVRNRKAKKSRFRPRATTPGPMRAVMVQQGLHAEDKKSKTLPPGQVVLYRVDEDDEEEEIHLEIIEPEEHHVPVCIRCRQPLDLNRICSGAEYSLFCCESFASPKAEEEMLDS